MLSEKEAIERLKKIRQDTITANECGLSNNDFIEEIEVYDMVLSLLDKLQKENKEKDKKIKKFLDIISKNFIEIIKDELVQQKNKEIILKDKQIDLMAEYINYLSDELVRETGKNELKFCDMEICVENDIDCEDCIKQYFKNKAKENEDDKL